MNDADYSFADRVTYTIPRAARLLRISMGQVRSWVTPQKKVIKGVVREIPPLWEPTIAPYQGQILITFLELMELKIVRAMIERRQVKRREVRACIRGWRDMTKGMPYYLVNRQFTPMLGPELMAEVRGEGVCVSVSTQQIIMKDIVMPERLDLEYRDDDDLPSRWIPKEWGGGIIVSPSFSSGKPIIKERPVPTEALAVTARVDGETSAARQWGVPIEAVQRAVAFEQSLDQKRGEAA